MEDPALRPRLLASCAVEFKLAGTFLSTCARWGVKTVFCCGTWPLGGDRWNIFFVFAVIGTSRQDRSPLVYLCSRRPWE